MIAATLTPGRAAATQRALDAALASPGLPAPEVFEWHGEPGRELFAAAQREQERQLHRQHAKQDKRRFTGEPITQLGGL